MNPVTKVLIKTILAAVFLLLLVVLGKFLWDECYAWVIEFLRQSLAPMPPCRP